MGRKCVFCEILEGRAQGSFVYRDDLVAAFLTIGPINPGHVLIVPVRHAAGLANLTPTENAAIFSVAQRVAAAIRQSSVECEGINLWLADGQAAFQDVFHVHLHVFPRIAGDSFRITFKGEVPDREELDRIAQSIKAGIATDPPV